MAQPAASTAHLLQGSIGTRTPQGVSIVRDSCGAPYLGGYRHKRTGTVFHNACSQTQLAKDTKLPKKERFCREAQTVDTKSRSTQSKREFGTQMPRPDLLLDASRDQVVSIGSYFSATELKMHAPTLLQRFLNERIGSHSASQ
jgi:hypothetical protein